MAWSRWTSGWLKSVTVPLDAGLRKVLADDSPHTANVSEEKCEIKGNLDSGKYPRSNINAEAWTTRRKEELDGSRLTVNEDKLAAYPHKELPPCRSAREVEYTLTKAKSSDYAHVEDAFANFTLIEKLTGGGLRQKWTSSFA